MEEVLVIRGVAKALKSYNVLVPLDHIHLIDLIDLTKKVSSSGRYS